MGTKKRKGWVKHADFMVLDFICLQLSYVISYWITYSFGNPYESLWYRYLAYLFFGCQLVFNIFRNNYKNIIRRGMYEEFRNVCKYMAGVLVLALAYLFLVQHTDKVSRLQFVGTSLLFLGIDWLARTANKKRICWKNLAGKSGGRRSIILITSNAMVEEAIEKLTGDHVFRDYTISGTIVLDKETPVEYHQLDIPVLPMNEEALARIQRGWVDEAFILQPDCVPYPTKLVELLLDMGITVHYTLSVLNSDSWGMTDLQKLGQYKVLTHSSYYASDWQLACKRLMDIAGGLVGCLLTVIAFLFLAPIIYYQSPGPIFFSQERIGRNGKTFKMYKFRSMYMDAEERKSELMKDNKIQNDMMFKVDEDPRIIGKKDKNGKTKGIGNFIRNTSLDEFPQFWNVLKGDMSLIGTRPPTPDEWNRYDYHHRVRMSIKPGITGMWQVSGRSEITDFEEVVKLDREYIENWSLSLDVKILLKTILVVLTGRGAG